MPAGLVCLRAGLVNTYYMADSYITKQIASVGIVRYFSLIEIVPHQRLCHRHCYGAEFFTCHRKCRPYQLKRAAVFYLKSIFRKLYRCGFTLV